MKKYLLQTTSAIIMAFGITAFANAQEVVKETEKEFKVINDKMGEYDELIIKKKGEKNVKVVVEIKDGVVTVNGKPVSEFDDEDVSVRKKRVIVKEGMPLYRNGQGYTELRTTRPPSPFRGGTYNFGDQEIIMEMNSNKALLGVVSEKDAAGAKITEVSEGSAAAKAGLQKGDIITKVDDIVIKGPDELSNAIGKYKPEEKATISYIRDKKAKKATAVLGKRQPSAVTIGPEEMRAFQFSPGNFEEMRKDFEFAFPEGIDRELDLQRITERRPRLGLKAQDTELGNGVKVLSVEPGSAAEKAGIKEGDLITNLDGTVVNSTDALSAASRNLKDKNAFKVQLQRNGIPQEIEVKIPKKLKTATL